MNTACWKELLCCWLLDNEWALLEYWSLDYNIHDSPFGITKSLLTDGVIRRQNSDLFIINRGHTHSVCHQLRGIRKRAVKCKCTPFRKASLHIQIKQSLVAVLGLQWNPVALQGLYWKVYCKGGKKQIKIVSCHMGTWRVFCCCKLYWLLMISNSGYNRVQLLIHKGLDDLGLLGGAGNWREDRESGMHRKRKKN